MFPPLLNQLTISISCQLSLSFYSIIMDNSIQESLLVPEELSNVDLKTRIWTESKMIWKIAFPAMVARVTSFGMIVVTQAFLGHIGKLELAAFALLQSFIVRFINGILVGSFFLHSYLFYCFELYGIIENN